MTGETVRGFSGKSGLGRFFSACGKSFAFLKHFPAEACSISEKLFKEIKFMTDQQFSQAARQYMDTIFRVAYGYLRSRSDADDVTQDVLIQLYKTDTVFRDAEHLKRWLIRVTVNRCKNIFRSPWHKMEDIADYENTLSFEAPECRELFDAVMALDKRYRLPVLLYYYEGYAQKEIADMLGIPEETVRTRLFRARGKLKATLTEVLQYD